MSRIFDALQQAAKDSAQAKMGCSDQSLEAVFMRHALRSSPSDDFAASLVALTRRIEALLPCGQGRIVAFAAVPDNPEASKLVGYFANVVACDLQKHVLVVALDAKADASAPEEAIDDVSGQAGGDRPGVSVQRINPSQLEWRGARTLPDGSLSIMDRARVWRQRFDWVFVEPPPADASAGADLLYTIADGVVVIVEAEKARWQIVKHRMGQIVEQQGRILGILLNKQRHHIPEFIYRHL